MDRKVLIKNHFEDYKGRLLKLIDEVDPNVLDQIATSFITAFKNDKTIWFCGNGGSAATASHMQVDFGYFVRYFSKRRPRVRALTDCTPIMTAIGNDNSYDALFTEQMQDNFDAGDVIICISASGNSMNVVNAAKYASELGGTSIAFVGFEGGKLNEVADISLFTPNPKGEYGPIEDLHTMIMHILVSYLEKDEEYLSVANPS
ncbi:SIS domain-containing protein [Cryomorphaceae bacterium]|nr:SIS domain-containing protein [Cryomorphaceae bacterium]